MARNRAKMREGPLAELFRATEAAQKRASGEEPPAGEPDSEHLVWRRVHVVCLATVLLHNRDELDLLSANQDVHCSELVI